MRAIIRNTRCTQMILHHLGEEEQVTTGQVVIIIRHLFLLASQTWVQISPKLLLRCLQDSRFLLFFLRLLLLQLRQKRPKRGPLLLLPLVEEQEEEVMEAEEELLQILTGLPPLLQIASRSLSTI